MNLIKRFDKIAGPWAAIGFTLILIGFLAFAIPQVAKADELIMADNPRCQYCIMFKAEVVPTYNESDLGKAFPLTILNMTDPATKVTHAWFVTAFTQNRRVGIFATPTFFVWKGDRETGESIGTIVGYTGTVRFYIQLDAIVNVVN